MGHGLSRQATFEQSLSMLVNNYTCTIESEGLYIVSIYDVISIEKRNLLVDLFRTYGIRGYIYEYSTNDDNHLYNTSIVRVCLDKTYQYLKTHIRQTRDQNTKWLAP